MRKFESASPDACPSFRGGAGVQYVAFEMLRRGIAPAFPIVDFGYDLLSDHQGLIQRLQIKSQFTVESDRKHRDMLRFQLRRRRPAFTALARSNRTRRAYTADQFDLMVFVNFVRHAVFLIPISQVNLKAHWISFPSDSPWRDAWHLLKKKNK